LSNFKKKIKINKKNKKKKNNLNIINHI